MSPNDITTYQRVHSHVDYFGILVYILMDVYLNPMIYFL